MRGLNEYFGNRVAKITPKGVVTEYSTGISTGALPQEIIVGPNKNLWFTENKTDQIARISNFK